MNGTLAFTPESAFCTKKTFQNTKQNPNTWIRPVHLHILVWFNLSNLRMCSLSLLLNIISFKTISLLILVLTLTSGVVVVCVVDKPSCWWEWCLLHHNSHLMHLPSAVMVGLRNHLANIHFLFMALSCQICFDVLIILWLSFTQLAVQGSQEGRNE